MTKSHHFCKWGDLGWCMKPEQSKYRQCVGVKQCIFHNKTKEEETASDGKTN